MGQPVSDLQVPEAGRLAAISAPHGFDPLPVFVPPIMLGNGTGQLTPFLIHSMCEFRTGWLEGLSEHHLDLVLASVVDQGDKRFYR